MMETMQTKLLFILSKIMMSKKPKQMDKHPLQTSILVNKNRSFVLYYSNYSMRKVFLKQLLKLFPFILHVCNSKVIFQGIFQERRIFFFQVKF